MKTNPIMLAAFMAFSALTLMPAVWAGADDHGAGEHADMKETKGPHNGKLLQDGAFVLEMTVFETGVPPEYRVYPYKNGKPLNPTEVGLRVTVDRLGGKRETFAFKPEGDYLRGQGRLVEPHSFDVTVQATSGGKNYQWKYDSYEGRTKLSPAAVKAAGIGTEKAGPATIRETLTLQGKLAFDPTRSAKVNARYPGTVKKLHVSLGDQVKAGQTLATVESNISLSGYAVTAPLAGTVVEVNAAVGEQAADLPLFVVADTSSLRATLQAFSTDAARIKPGQVVLLSQTGSEDVLEAKVQRLVPDAASSFPVMLVSFDVSNTAGNLMPGSSVTGKVVVDEREVPLAVQTKGLQAFRDFTVVYAQVGDTYEVRMLELGADDGQRVEVLVGLEVGETYVTDNSYIIKADIDKSGASHDH